MTMTERLHRITAIFNSVIEAPSDSAVDDAIDELRDLIKPFPNDNQSLLIKVFWIFADGAPAPEYLSSTPYDPADHHPERNDC